MLGEGIVSFGVPLLATDFRNEKSSPKMGAYLRKWKRITAPAKDRVETVRQLLAVLGVASLDAFKITWAEGSVAYRRAAVGRDNAPALATWLALAERHHEELRDVCAFDRAGLETLIRLIAFEGVLGVGVSVAG